jgi:pyruvate,water dikinase
MSGFEGGLVEWLGSATGGAGALGGKGASVDRLAKLGFRVPPGFCLTTAAFRAQLEAAPAPGSAASRATEAMVDGVAAALREATQRLGREVQDALQTAPRFAVRSSAIGEDGSAASYAGLHETELGVAPDEVPGAVQRCWASLWSAPAIAYRARRDLADDDAEMAVVVQALVPADAAAVVFTRHPVTGRDDQLVITTVHGLGDAMVAGTVTPDTYVVDRAGGGVVTFEPGQDPRGPALDASTLAALVDLCLAVEAAFKRPVDIEAAVSGGTWYLLQARPITAGLGAGRGAS